MLLDGIPVPEWARPWAGWVLGTDWPKGKEGGLFRLADGLVKAARDVAAGADGDGIRLGAEGWDGAALRAFQKRVSKDVGGRQAALVRSLVDLALACNELGVQLEFTKRMMRLAVLLLVVQLAWLMWALVSPAGGLTLRLMGVRAQAARWTVRQFARRLLINIALFGGLLGGMDLLVQLTQSRREGVDWRQVGSSAATGALTGGLLTGLAWAFPTRSLWMLMGQSGVANAGTVLISQLWDGDEHIDGLLVLKGLTSGVIGGADSHWASWSPDGGHVGPRPPDGHARPDNPGLRDGPPDGTRPDDAADAGYTRLADAGETGHRTLPDGGDAPPHPRTTQRSVDELINWSRSGEPGSPRLRDHAAFGESASRGVVAREPLSGARGETVKLDKATLADGSHAVEKEFSGTDRRDREHLNSRLGRTVGAEVPATHITGERHLLIDWVDGEHVPVRGEPDDKWYMSRLHNTREGILLGLLDALTGNHDRFSPGRATHDFLAGRDGIVRGYDGDKTFTGRLPDTDSPFVRHFFRDKGVLADWAPNPLSKSDVETLRTRIEALRTEFRGHEDWYASVKFAFEKIAENASGTVSVLDAPPGSMIVEPRAAGPEFGQRPRTFEGTTPPRAPDAVPPERPSSAGDSGDRMRARPVRSYEFDPDYRTPLLPVHGESVLDKLRGVLSNCIDPRQAVRASEWAHLRKNADPWVVESRNPQRPVLDASALVEARRFAIRGDEVRTVTEFTVKIKYVAEKGMTSEQVARLKSNALDGVDRYYNHQHRLRDGSQLHVRLEFQEVRNAQPGDLEVVTFRAADGRADMLTWYADNDGHIHAHEIGHHLGLADEYLEPPERGRRTLTDRHMEPGDNLMGDALRVKADGGVLLDHAGHEVPPVAALRDHHLVHFDDLVPASQRFVEGEAGFRQPADEWTRAAYRPEQLRLSDHLRDLLGKFPHRDGDLIDHVRMLDRAYALFGDRLTQRHLDYVRALVDTAHSLYGAAPDAVTVRDLRRLSGLVTFLGWKPDVGPLDGAWVRARSEAVLGGGHADARMIEGLSRLREWFAYTDGRPQPGETGPQVMRRAAGEFFGEPPSEAGVRRAATLFSEAAERSPVLADGSPDYVRVTTELRARQGGEWQGRAYGGDDFGTLVEQLHDDQGGGQPAGPPKAPAGHPQNKGPAWDARRVGEAVADWGARPHGGKPHAFSPAELVAARRRVQPVHMGARDPEVAAIERRDLTVKARDGVMRPVTEYTVRFAYRSDTSPLGHLGTRVRAGLDQFVNGRYVLPDGSTLLVRAEFVPAERRGVTIGHRDEAPGSKPSDFPHGASHVDLALKVLDQLGMDDVLGPPQTTEPAPRPDAVAAHRQAAWDMRRVGEAVTDWGATPHGGKPHAFGPAELVAARRQVEPVKMGARDPGGAAIERRDLTLKPKDGVVRRVTEYTVKFAYRSDMSQADLGYFGRRVRAALSRFVDGRYVLPDGSVLLVRAEFAPTELRGVTIGHRDEAPGSRSFDFLYEASYAELALKVLDQLGMDDVLGPG
ncbi:WXG100-like domain-containing protein [Nonomuraea guangzhouensis]|uniref:Outer membrane channel protein CpnT-like N-terminal domain-containing protein n=1 Tax=Nonomuraea guangzhouensis TaxID=1291555 RepID=A0ABW4GHK0_9ACTN|nr:hypothetical protein [Nonomuraea guangzhouensis]